ncbi:M23 family metallopeptidase, partial [bacterium]|nr:M23 family metallopeptidase [bacterium]
INRVMQWHLDIESEYRDGDKITLLLTPYDEPGRRFSYRILALDYQGAEVRTRAYYFRETEHPFGAHYDADGYEHALHLESSPVPAWQEITSLVGDGRGHKGVDFKTPKFTPLHAPVAGTITRINWNTRNNGNCLEIISEDGAYTHKFLHLEKFPAHVHAGMRVRVGDFIGYTGNTGHSSGPHLHYQVERILSPEQAPGGAYTDTQVVDPYRVFATLEEHIDECDAEAFEMTKAVLDAMLNVAPPTDDAKTRPVIARADSQGDSRS